VAANRPRLLRHRASDLLGKRKEDRFVRKHARSSRPEPCSSRGGVSNATSSVTTAFIIERGERRIIEDIGD
jgi:hypothetical protein